MKISEIYVLAVISTHTIADALCVSKGIQKHDLDVFGDLSKSVFILACVEGVNISGASYF